MPEVFNSQANLNSPVSSSALPSAPAVIPTDGTPPGQSANIPVAGTTFQDPNVAANAQASKVAAPTNSTTPDFSSPIITRSVNEFSQVMSLLNPAINPFKAFAPKPVNTFFESADSQENVLLLLRQHPITQLKWVIFTIGLALVPFLLSYVNILGFLPYKFHVVAALSWYMMVLGFALESFLDWFFNAYIITDQRIIDVEFTSMLFKHVSSAKFERIEDVNFTSSGTLGAIFDYGNVLIQTAAATDEFQFDNVPYPSRVTNFINDLLTEIERQNGLNGKVTG